MPIELDPEVIDTHAPVLSALAEQLQQEAEAALFATDELQQLFHVAGMQALNIHSPPASPHPQRHPLSPA